MYQTGQAVIYPLGTIFFKTEDGWCLFSGEDVGLLDGGRNGKFATEAEILAEAVKHGWEIYVSGETIRIDSPSKELYFFKFFKSKNREFQIGGSYQIANVKDLSLFGQECIAAHRLITALNLTKPQQ